MTKIVCSKIDCVFLIGGDIFTIPEYLRNKRVYQYYNPLIQFGTSLNNKNIKQVLFGASIGPCGEYKKAKKYYFSFLKKIDLIVARENRCIDYLTENSIVSNLSFFPDPAFFVSNGERFDSVCDYIGINLSELSLREVYGNVSSNILDSCANLVKTIHYETGLKILLIPHVFSPFSDSDNDYSFLKKIHQLLDPQTKKSVSLSEPKSFLDAKKYIRKCKLVVTARMHCGISAVSELVPTIFLSYSEKTKGIVKYIYNDSKSFLHLSKIDKDLVPLVHHHLNKLKEMRLVLESRMPQIKNEINDNELFLSKIKSVCMSNGKK